MNWKHKLKGAVLCFALGVVMSSVMAQVPDQTNYQGILRDANDVPLTGDYAMTFRFFDAEALGNEILVDTHAVVSVDGGLFDVVLGSGVVTDGAGVFPGDPYLSLTQMFRDFGNVWIELEIDGETLSPRSKIASVPYAMNAESLNGLAAGDYLDTSANPQVKSGALTIGGVDVDGQIRLVNDFFTTIRFSDSGDPNAERFSWDSADNVFEMSAGLQTDGLIIVGDTTNLPLGYNRIGPAGSPSGANISTVNDLFVADSLEANGDIYFSGDVQMDNDGPDQDQNLFFYNNGSPTQEVLKWDEPADRFEFSNALALAGSLRVGSTTASDEAYSIFNAFGGVPDSDDMNGTQDVYIEGDLEVDDALYLNSELIMLDLDDSQVDVDQFIFFYDNQVMDDEWLMWENDAGNGVDRFEFSDSLHVGGDLTALVKNFVQDHPTRDDVEIVYTSLEGDEVSVFTRGTARLINGEATVSLGETFPLIANPDIGLTAHLTPRTSSPGLFIHSLTSETLIVRSVEQEDVVFDYLVHGLRMGYEHAPALRPKTTSAPLPSTQQWDQIYEQHPGLKSASAMQKYQKSHLDNYGEAVNLDRSQTYISNHAVDRPDEPPMKRRVRQQGENNDGVQSGSVRSGDSTLRIGTPESEIQDSSQSASDSPTVQTHTNFNDQVIPVASLVEIGDVVRISEHESTTYERTTVAEDRLAVGIIGDPELSVEEQLKITQEFTEMAPLATHGIVMCKVDATYAPIQQGDLLVSSQLPGHAMRATNPMPGTVIGKALEPFESGTGLIRVLVMAR